MSIIADREITCCDMCSEPLGEKPFRYHYFWAGRDGGDNRWHPAALCHGCLHGCAAAVICHAREYAGLLLGKAGDNPLLSALEAAMAESKRLRDALRRMASALRPESVVRQALEEEFLWLREMEPQEDQ